jgi:hypothetical protein
MVRGIWPAGGTRKRNTVSQSFYCQALPDDERAIFESAHREHGLDGEVTLLRTQLLLLLRNSKTRTNPATVQLTMRAIDLVVKALRAHGTRGEPDQSALEHELERAAAAIQQRAGA